LEEALDLSFDRLLMMMMMNISGSATGQTTSEIHKHTVTFCLAVTYQGVQLDKQKAKYTSAL